MLKGLGKSILIYGIASGISQSIMLVLVPLYTRVFGPDEYGMIDLIFTLTSFASIIGMLQLESAVARYFYEDDQHDYKRRLTSTAFWIIVVFSSILMVVIILLAEPISILVFGNADNQDALRWAGIVIPLFNVFAFLSMVLRFMKKPMLFMSAVLIQLITTVSLAIWLVYVEQLGIIGVFMAQAGGLLLASIAAIFYMRQWISFQVDTLLLRRLFKFSIPLIPAVTGTWINNYFNRIVMLGYLTLADIGIYTVALKIASVFKLFENAFRMAWGPYKWESLKKKDHRLIYQEIMKVVSIAVFSMVAIFSLFSSELLSIVATPEYKAAEPLIAILGFAFGLNIILQTIGYGPSIREKTIYNTLIFFASVTVNIVALFILVPEYGLNAVPFCLAISALVLVIVSWTVSEKLYYIGFSKLLFSICFFLTLGVLVLNFQVEIDFLYRVLLSFAIILIALLWFVKHPKLEVDD